MEGRERINHVKNGPLVFQEALDFSIQSSQIHSIQIHFNTSLV